MASIPLLAALVAALIGFAAVVLVHELETPVVLSVWLSTIVTMSGLLLAWMIRTWLEVTLVETTGGLGATMFLFAGFYELLA